jgi:nicotinate-nucleotide adenylyltransferase
MKNIGLLFGSFNPIHNGHITLATFILKHKPLDEIWFVVSPLSPFKKSKILLDKNDRLDMVKVAIKPFKEFFVSDIEFKMKTPNYTIDTLYEIKKKYPEDSFSLIIGEDNLENFKNWKDSNLIIENFKIYVYPRNFSKSKLNLNFNTLNKINAPSINISSTDIRESIKKNEGVDGLLSPEVLDQIKKKKLYL